MSLTKNDLELIKQVVKEGLTEEFPRLFASEFPKAFASEFPKAFANEFPKAFSASFPEHFRKAFESEYPRLKKEMGLMFADAINELILPQFTEMREWREDTEHLLQMLFSEMKRGFHYLKDRTDENVIFTDEVGKDNEELIGKYYEDFVKKSEHEKLKKRVRKLELART